MTYRFAAEINVLKKQNRKLGTVKMKNPSKNPSVQPGTERIGFIWSETVPDFEKVKERFEDCVVFADGVKFF